jgi:hypothetical protein
LVCVGFLFLSSLAFLTSQQVFSLLCDASTLLPHFHGFLRYVRPPLLSGLELGPESLGQSFSPNGIGGSTWGRGPLCPLLLCLLLFPASPNPSSSFPLSPPLGLTSRPHLVPPPLTPFLVLSGLDSYCLHPLLPA